MLLYVNFVAVMLEFDLDNTNWTSGFLSFFLLLLLLLLYFFIFWSVLVSLGNVQLRTRTVILSFFTPFLLVCGLKEGYVFEL